MNPPVPSDYTALRLLAETRLLNNPALRPALRSLPADGQNPALAHELAVQRIMFDLQYEELCAAYAEIQSGLERYQDLYDFAPIGFFNLAPDGTIQLANLTAARLAGTERERLLGTPFSRLLVEQDRSEFSIFLERVNATGTRQACELLLLNLATPTVNVRLEATRSLDGREFRLAMLDITAHKLAESASIRLAAIVESSDDAIIGKDLNSIITSWNKGAERIFGYTAAEMVGASILKLIPADRRDEENLILGKIRRGECVEHFETLRQTKDGRLIDVSVTASPIKDASGQPIGVSKIARDITDRLSEFSYGDIEVNRLALNMPQVEQFNPPPNPAKITDSRAKAYIDEFGAESWELDALEPAVIAQLIRDNVYAHRDAALWDAKVAEEETARKQLTKVSDNWEEITENLPEDED